MILPFNGLLQAEEDEEANETDVNGQDGDASEDSLDREEL